MTPAAPPIRTRPLMTWDRTPGFLCDWHLAGFFESGLRYNDNPSLFDAKISDRWKEDHLAPWGGCEKIRHVPAATGKGAAVEWQLLPLSWSPQLSLRKSREEYENWNERCKDADPDLWLKLYYALALVESPHDCQAELLFSGWDGCRLWINGKMSFDEHSFHHCIYDMERVPVALKAGVNSFLFQLDRDGVVARLATPDDPEFVKQLKGMAAGDDPPRRAVSTFTSMRRHAAGLKIQMPFNGMTNADLSAWQKSFAAHYQRCLGPEPPRGAGEPVCTNETACDGYVRKTHVVPCEGGGSLECFVLIPEKSRRNGRAVLSIHGHTDPYLVAGLVKPKRPGGLSGQDLNNYTERLAQKGFVTAQTVQRGFGIRNDYFGGDDPCNVAGWQALSMGLTLPRLHIADLHRLHELMCATPGVDAKRVGVGGLSGGGTLSYLSGAFDERFKAVCVMCGMCRYEDFAMGENGCGLQIVPGLYPAGDVGEVLGLIAPRPLLLGQGDRDSTFNVIRFRSIADDAAKAYQAAGAADRLQVEVFNLAHEFHVDLAEQFFLKWL